MDLIINSERPTKNFTQTPNELVTDRTLSPEARLILILVLSKPNGWTIRRQEIINSLGISMHVYKRASKELRAWGHLTTEISRHPATGEATGRTMHFHYRPLPPKDNLKENEDTKPTDQNHRKVVLPTVGKTTRSRVENQPDFGSVFAPTSKKDILRTAPPIKHSTQSRATAPEDQNAKMGKKAKTEARAQTRLKQPAQTTTSETQIEQLAQYQNWLAENKGSSYSEYLFWRGPPSNAPN